MRSALAVLLLSTLASDAAANSPRLVADLMRRSETIAHSSPRFLRPMLGRVAIFTAKDGGEQARLWRSDGTREGTFALVPDFQTPPFEVLGSTHADGVIYLGAAEWDGYRIWRTDGTIAGTRPLTAYAASPVVPVAAVGQTIYFLGDAFRELWALDATGARRLARVTEAEASRHWATVWGGHLYLAIETGLWKSDGTVAGTVRLTPNPSFGVVSAQDGVLFAATDAVNGTELWRSDGTATGTRLLADLNQGASSTFNRNASSIVSFKSGVLFLGLNGEVGVSDGSTGGTRILRQGEIPGPPPSDIETMAGIAYFAHNDGRGKRLWRSDGTEVGTFAVHEGAELPPISQIAAGTSHVYYFVEGPNPMAQLIATDGTPRGMRVVGEFSRLWINTVSLSLVTSGDDVFFSFDDGERGIEPWIGDATGPRTLLADVGRDVGGSSNPREMRPSADGTLHFLADDDEGTHVWEVDGTSGGVTRLLESDHLLARTPEGVYFQRAAALWIRSAAGTERLLHEFDDDDYPAASLTVSHLVGTTFIRADNGYNSSIWSTDGTVAGTRQLTGRFDHSSDLIVAAGQPWFTAGSSTGAALWTTNGTEESTRAVAASSVSAPVAFRGAVYAFGGGSLRRFSGAPGEVEVVREFEDFNSPVRSWVAGETMFFAFSPSINNSQLWKTDGTTEGTVLVRKFPEHFGAISSAAAIGSRLVFIVDDGVHGHEPWVTDGTPEGTRILRDIQPVRRMEPGGMFEANGLVYFAAETIEHGRELWQTDGSPAGTILTADVHRGWGSSSPKDFVRAGDTLYFTAFTGELGRELWAYPLSPAGSLSINDTRVRENAGNARVAITLSHPYPDPVRVDFETRNGTAVAGIHYTRTTGTVSFAPGELVKTITVPILNDTTETRPLRSFTVVVHGATVPLRQREAAVMIDDDDATADVSIRRDGWMIKVRNDGPSLASNVRACMAAPPYEPWWCVRGLQLAAGEEYELRHGPVDRLLVARVTHWETDPDPSNNSLTLTFSGGFGPGLSLDRNVLRTGERARLTLESSEVTVTSSDPGVASVGAATSQPPSYAATVNALEPGRATIVAHSGPYEARIPIRVIATGEVMRALPLLTIPMHEMRHGVPNEIIVRVDGVTLDGETPTGPVTLKLGGSVLGEASVQEGKATILFHPPLPAGPLPLTATYRGDENFYDASTHEPYISQVNAFADVRVRKLEGDQFLITLRGIAGHVPTGAIRVSLHPAPEPLTAPLARVDDATSSATIRLGGDPRTLYVEYAGDSFYSYSADYVAVDSGGHRKRAVRH